MENLLQYAALLVLLSAGATSLRFPKNFDTTSCPADYQNNHPLIILSMDGFRADYLDRGLTPTIEALSNSGIKAPFIKPSYPSITFPNHYTIVTGLLPPAHGIVANKFYDPVFNATFRVGRKEFFEKRWWGGEPIWVTAEKQGKIAATYFWPGSETVGLRPTHWLPYNESHHFNVRVDSVLKWLDLPAKERPDLINFYLHEPDRQGHEHGPDSVQVANALKTVDGTLRYFLEGLEARNLLSCVNIMILADHGMAAAGRERLIYLQDYISNIANVTRFWDGVFPRFERLDQSPVKTQTMMEQLSCKRREMRVYHKRHLPVRWHLGAQRRVEDVVLDLDAGYQIDFDGTYEPDEGDHGYDNIFHVMNALFLAHGPAFRRGLEVESFQNIELYNLMCAVLGITPAPNNGTWGSLHYLMNYPPPIHDLVDVRIPFVAKVTKSSKHLKRASNGFSAESDETEEDESENSDRVISLLRSAEVNFNHLLKRHLPWGVPQHQKNPVKLLFQHDHITGFSEDLKLPVWVAFRLDRAEGSSVSEWVDDIRIAPKHQIDLRNEKLQVGFNWEPLFHQVFSKHRWMEELPFLTTNAVPLSKLLSEKWSQLRRLIRSWGQEYGAVNVVMGTIFDYDSDSFADNLDRRFSQGQTNVPTHLFAVVTRCLGGGGLGCRQKYLDVNAFIFPQYLAVTNCMKFESFAREFMAKVDDVEKAAGIQLFPLLKNEDRIRLKVRVHSNIWGREIWENRLQSDTFGLRR